MSVTTCHPDHLSSDMKDNIHNAAVDACDKSILEALRIASCVSVSYDHEEDTVHEIIVWFEPEDKQGLVATWDPNYQWDKNDEVVSYLCRRLGTLIGQHIEPIPIEVDGVKHELEADTGQYINAEERIVFLLHGEEVEPQLLVKHLMEKVETLGTQNIQLENKIMELEHQIMELESELTTANAEIDRLGDMLDG